MPRAPSRVFFPWERRRGVLGLLGRARTRLAAAAFACLVLLVVVHGRERHDADVRATRAAIGDAERAVMAYRADHGGKCPPALGDVATAGYLRDPPLDAWGQQLRLTCPGRHDPQGFDLTSDGPDGLPGGLDRVQ